MGVGESGVVGEDVAGEGRGYGSGIERSTSGSRSSRWNSRSRKEERRASCG